MIAPDLFSTLFSFIFSLQESAALLTIFVIRAAPVWLTFGLVVIFWSVWVPYRRAAAFAKVNYILLEIKLPREQTKSPLAMEIFFDALHQLAGESTWYDKYILGKTRAYFSLEIASVDGSIRFFIRARDTFKNFLETQIYSQYPDVEIHEVPDYTLSVPYAREGSDWSLFGVEYKLKREDPYPIKTYVDYRLDMESKEELKIDPITPMLEYCGACGRNEQIWFQIIVRANKGKRDPTLLFGRNEDWQERGKKIIEEIIAKAKMRGKTPDEESGGSSTILTEGERNQIKAIERKIGKLGYDCGIRALYLAKNEAFNPANISGLFGSIKQYATNDLNMLMRRIHTDFDYPWQHYINIPVENPNFGVPFFSLKGHRLAHRKYAFFDAYRKRSWFYPPYQRPSYVLNTEELATIYHFPGSVAATPSFRRIESRRGEPPADLPV